MRAAEGKRAIASARQPLRRPAALLLALALCLLAGPSLAQLTGDDPEWKETDAPPPPASFDADKMVPFDVSVNSSLKFGIDPVSLRVGRDGVVRYVVIARNASGGALNAMYEGIRCATGEFKTYARYGSDRQWNAVSRPQWVSLFAPMPSHHSLTLAKLGVCNGNAPGQTPASIVLEIKGQNPSKIR